MPIRTLVPAEQANYDTTFAVIKRAAEGRCFQVKAPEDTMDIVKDKLEEEGFSFSGTGADMLIKWGKS